MATVTLGTNANNTLTAIKWDRGVSIADVAVIAAGIKNDNIIPNASNFAFNPVVQGAFVRFGQLYIPNRGYLTLEPGDYVGFDPQTGWPILVSGPAITNPAGSGWSHT